VYLWVFIWYSDISARIWTRLNLLPELFVLSEILFRYKEMYFTPKYNGQNYTNFCPEASSYQTETQHFDVSLPGNPKLCTGGPRCYRVLLSRTNTYFFLSYFNCYYRYKHCYCCKIVLYWFNRDFWVCFSFVNIPISSATSNCKRPESPRNFSKVARGSGTPTQDVTYLYDSIHNRLQRFPQRGHRSEQICTELGFYYTLASPLVCLMGL